MFYAGGIAGLLVLLLWLYCIFDVIVTEEIVMRNMPKIVWLAVVVFLPTVGSVAWLALGRPERAAGRPGGVGLVRPAERRVGPEDSPEFMLRTAEEARRLRRWEEDLRKREDRLRRLEEGDEG